jgi:hypothetical protein
MALEVRGFRMFMACVLISIVHSGKVEQNVILQNSVTEEMVILNYSSLEEVEKDIEKIKEEIKKLEKDCPRI